MTVEEAIEYFIKCNENLISVAKDENVYNFERQQIETICSRRAFEANKLAIKALELTQTGLLKDCESCKAELPCNVAKEFEGCMTREEIAKAVREIREHCRNNYCTSCEAHTVDGCVFMSSYPNEWIYWKAEKEDSNESI